MDDYIILNYECEWRTNYVVTLKSYTCVIILLFDYNLYK